MNNRVIILKDSSGIDKEIAHIYEHSLLLRLYAHIASVGASPGLSVWFGGESFHYRGIFIEAIFFSDKAQKLFHEFIKSEPAYSRADIELAIKDIEPEERSEIIVRDWVLLEAQIEELRSRKWHDSQSSFYTLEDKKQAKNKKIIRIVKDDESFKDVRLTYTFKSKDISELALSNRLVVSIGSDVLYKLKAAFSAYGGEIGYVANTSGTRNVTVECVIRKSVSDKKILAIAEESLASITKPKNYQCIKSDFDSWSKNIYAHFVLNEYLRHNDTLTSAKFIADSLNLDRLRTLIRKIKVTI